MATLVLTPVGGAIGGPIGATVYGDRGWAVAWVGFSCVVLGMLGACSEMGVRH